MPTEELFGNWQIFRQWGDTLAFDLQATERQDDIAITGEDDGVSSLTIAINGVQDEVAEDHDYPPAGHDAFAGGLDALGYTASDDLWK